MKEGDEVDLPFGGLLLQGALTQGNSPRKQETKSEIQKSNSINNKQSNLSQFSGAKSMMVGKVKSVTLPRED